MNREETIFEQALGIDSASAREVYLREACAGNEPLLKSLQGLLSVHDRAGKFMDPRPQAGSNPSIAALLGTASAPVTEKPGDRIGRYKLLEKIGEGGCGVVYMAEQEEPVRRRVALKVIKLGMDTEAVIARFEAERQALAMMDHPNIAKIFDAGVTGSSHSQLSTLNSQLPLGRPYFVMELVRGTKITEFCDHNTLTTSARLDLFMQVCRAIQHAHQKGIIHRDIKPSNILVTLHDGVPVPKVIDFGIAKATQGRLTDKTVFTGFHQFIGTPAYMSPEQAEMSGLDIDTRSDIYSLGVLLYELLTGKTPFDGKELFEAGLDAMRRTIRELEPERPSTKLSTMVAGELTTTANRRQTESPKLIHAVRGDLDWIVMKALDKDRTRRYETANGLASDLQRHLNNEPVIACPPSNIYRFRKLIRRNKLQFAAGTAILVALLVGLVVSTWMFAKERQERRRALAAEESARTKQREAEAARQGLEVSEREKSQNLYIAEVGLARSAWEDGQLQHARDLLRSHIPKAGEKDLRGFEWRYLWQLCQEDAMVTLTGHKDYVQCIALSPDGKLLASGSGDGTVKLWDPQTHEETGTLQSTDKAKEIRSLAFSPDGTTLAVANFSTNLKLWDVVTRRPLGTLGGVAAWEKAIKIFPNGKLLACADSDGLVTLWNLKEKILIGSLQGGETARPAICISPTGAILASSTGNGDILLWDVASRGQIGSLRGHAASVDCLEFSPDGAVLASSSSDCTIHLWGVAQRREMAVLSGHRVSVSSVTFSPDGKRLASTSIDGMIKLWDIASKTELRTLRGHTAMVNQARFLPDGKMLASASDDRTIKLWDVFSDRNAAMLKGLGGPAKDFRFLEDGKTLGVLALDGNVTFWDPATGDQKGRLSGRFKGFSDTGTIVFGQTTNGELEFWDITTQRLVAAAKGQPGPAFSPVFSPDDHFFACADTNGTVRLWEVASGRLQGALPGPLPGSPGSIIDLWFPSGTGNLILGIKRGLNVYINLNFEQAMFRSGMRHWRGSLRHGANAYFRFWDPLTSNEAEALPKDVRRMRQPLDNGISLSILHNDCGGTMLDCPDLSNIEDHLLSSVPSFDRNMLFIGGERDITAWNLGTGHIAAVLRGHGGWVSSLSLSLDGKRLVSAANDGTLRLWNLEMRKELLAFPARISLWSVVALSADDSTVAALSPVDRLIRVFHAPSLKSIEEAENRRLALGTNQLASFPRFSDSQKKAPGELHRIAKTKDPP